MDTAKPGSDHIFVKLDDEGHYRLNFVEADRAKAPNRNSTAGLRDFFVWDGCYE